MELRASSSGTTFTILTIARYLGMEGDKLQLLRLGALAFLVPQHHSFLEVLLGSSQLCGSYSPAAGPDCWSNLLPQAFHFDVPSGACMWKCFCCLHRCCCACNGQRGSCKER